MEYAMTLIVRNTMDSHAIAQRVDQEMFVLMNLEDAQNATAQ
jgi:hypothetical protein